MARDRDGGDDRPNRLAGSLFAAESAELAGRGEQTRRSLSSRNSLAVEYCARGRVDEAVPLLERAWDGCRTVLGPRDPDTLIVAGNLAAAQALLGRWDDALPMLQANLAERADVLGDTHPATLDARDALAVAQRLAGAVADALVTHRLVTAQRLRELGPAHPDTLTSRMGLAIAEADSGELDIAIEILDDALAVATAQAGDARLALELRLNLAVCLSAAGEPERARRLLTTVLTDCETRWGHNHPRTVSVRHELSDLRGSGAG